MQHYLNDDSKKAVAVDITKLGIMEITRKKEKNTLLVVDTLVPYLILGQAIGRWGNFINKEAHGISTSLSNLKSMHLPNFIIEGMYINGNYYIPTFLYESLWCFLGFILLIIISSPYLKTKKCFYCA